MPRLRNGDIKICPSCKEEFYCRHSELVKRIFCSRTCANKERTPKEKSGVLVPCGFCKKNTYVFPCDIKKRDNHFCSRTCANKFNGPRVGKLSRGKIVSQETREKLKQYRGDKHWAWKGDNKCPKCGIIIDRGSKTCLKHQKRKSVSKEHRLQISNRLIGKMPINIMREGKFGNVKRGWHFIGGTKYFFRSNWEANYARYLNWLKNRGDIKDWEYEAKVFIFEKIQFGTRSYRPDFMVTNKDNSVEFHEVKGWLTPKSNTQLKRMAKYFPQIKIILIDSHSYSDIKKKIGAVVGFE